MNHGPQPMSHAERWELAESIAQKLISYYDTQLIAIGVYGSLARNEDGPYSDIEMHCILRGEKIESSYEWSTGRWKAEVDVYSPDVILSEAAFVDGDWPITHGAYIHIKPLFDPEDFFEKLHAAVWSNPEKVFSERCREVIVGEIYELVGKIRNMHIQKSNDLIAIYVTKLAMWGACLLGLHQRHLFTSLGRLFEEAHKLPDHPQGFEALVRMVTSGNLQPAEKLWEAANIFWDGIESWAKRNHLPIETSLDALLQEGAAD